MLCSNGSLESKVAGSDIMNGWLILMINADNKLH